MIVDPNVKMAVIIAMDVFLWCGISVLVMMAWILSEYWTAKKMNPTVRFWPFFKHWHEKGKAGYL